jgi:NAD(P)-dependent dehydrogenase (short-subunit alcohol dehydrogenase family)
MGLQGAKILVVGGGSGIGFAVAKAAVAEGAEVTIVSTNADKLAAASGRLGGVTTAVLDITEEAAVAAFFAQSCTFDHIASTAGDWGEGGRGTFTELDMKAAEDLFRVRLWGSAILAKHGAAWLAPGGSLTFTGGMSAWRPAKGSVMATAMAGSLGHLTIGLAKELAPLRVNAVFPGGVATEVYQGLSDSTRSAWEARYASQPLPRIGEPGEVAEAYLYLMKAGYTTGQILQVDGGAMLAG